MGFELRELDIEDISRAQKQSVRSDVKYDAGEVGDNPDPLKGTCLLYTSPSPRDRG